MSIEIWGKPACPSCMKAKAFCESHKYPYVYKELGKDFDREQISENFPVQEPPDCSKQRKDWRIRSSVKLY